MSWFGTAAASKGVECATTPGRMATALAFISPPGKSGGRSTRDIRIQGLDDDETKSLTWFFGPLEPQFLPCAYVWYSEHTMPSPFPQREVVSTLPISSRQHLLVVSSSPDSNPPIILSSATCLLSTCLTAREQCIPCVFTLPCPHTPP